jgi:hypothetical protein
MYPYYLNCILHIYMNFMTRIRIENMEITPPAGLQDFLIDFEFEKHVEQQVAKTTQMSQES